MLFSVDAHTIGCHLTGNEVYIRNLLNEFAGLDDSAQFLAYVARPEAEACVPRRFARRNVSNNPFLRLGYQIPVSLMREKPDLIHVQYTGPLACPVPMVVTVHDVSYLQYPEYFTRWRALQLRMTVKRTVHRAARILTPSEFSKRSIVETYGLPDEKVVVVPNGVDPMFHPIHREGAAAQVREHHGIERPFVLTVGDLQPRKNHIGLIHAFEETMRAYPHLPHELVLVGKEAWFAPHVRRVAERSPLADRIRFTGWVADEDLRYLYGACDLFVFPSFYEGFGLPILEAMACGRAVACSNTSAMPEVANAAAVQFDPHSVHEIARAMQDLLLDEELRTRMERLGSKRAARFHWTRTAERTLDVYYDVAGQRRPRAERVYKKRVVSVRT